MVALIKPEGIMIFSCDCHTWHLLYFVFMFYISSLDKHVIKLQGSEVPLFNSAGEIIMQRSNSLALIVFTTILLCHLTEVNHHVFQRILSFCLHSSLYRFV